MMRFTVLLVTFKEVRINTITLNDHKIVKHTFKILQQMLCLWSANAARFLTCLIILGAQGIIKFIFLSFRFRKFKSYASKKEPLTYWEAEDDIAESRLLIECILMLCEVLLGCLQNISWRLNLILNLRC